MTGQVREGSEILLAYRIRLSDGRVVEEGEGDDALHMTVGEGVLPEMVEASLVGMEEGESLMVALAVEENAFGEYDPDKVLHLARAEFGDQVEPETGSLVGFTLPGGEEIAGRVVSVSGEQVEVDFNHPLVGHDVLFEVEVLEVLEEGG